MKHCIIKHCIFFVVSSLAVLSFSIQPVAAQTAMMPNLVSAEGEQMSMADVIKKVMATPQTKAVTENTEANVKSAIEGPLIFEEKTPEVNLETVEAIDPKTKRYPPRIRLNFKEFPLIKIAASEEDKEPDTFAEINLHQTDLIVSRIRQRIKQDKIDVVFKGRTATLTGSVASQRQMELAETMLRFEPGIDTVENKLTVKP